MNERIVNLLILLINGSPLDEEDSKYVDNWVAASPHNRKVFMETMFTDELIKDLKETLSYDRMSIVHKLVKKMEKKEAKYIK